MGRCSPVIQWDQYNHNGPYKRKARRSKSREEVTWGWKSRLEWSLCQGAKRSQERQGIDSPLSLQKEPAQLTLILVPSHPCLTSDLQNYERINLRCFKLLNLQNFFMAAMEKYTRSLKNWSRHRVEGVQGMDAFGCWTQITCGLCSDSGLEWVLRFVYISISAQVMPILLVHGPHLEWQRPRHQDSREVSWRGEEEKVQRLAEQRGLCAKAKTFDLILEDIGNHWTGEHRVVFFKLVFSVKEPGRAANQRWVAHYCTAENIQGWRLWRV